MPGENIGEKFPDKELRRILESKAPNHIITQEFCDSIKSIRIVDRGIKSMEGISCFRNLETLNCGYNLLESLDLSRNNALVEVNCYYNNLKQIKLPSTDKLAILRCYENPELKKIVIHKTPATLEADPQMKVVHIKEKTR